MSGLDHLFYVDIAEERIGGPFDPRDLSDLVLFLDSRQVVTNPVSDWPDLSPNTFICTQGDPNKQPAIGAATSPTGAQLVSFDGDAIAANGDRIEIIITSALFPTVANGYTFILAGNLKTCKKAPASNASVWLDGPTAHHPRHLYEDGNFTHLYAIDDSAGQSTFTAFSSGNQRLTYVWSAGIGGPIYTGTVELFRSGVSQGSVAYTMNHSGLISNLSFGDLNAVGQACFMDVACFLWYKRALSALERAQIDQWIADQFGY